jgi:predicted MPP superfamily phosphohydrolase
MKPDELEKYNIFLFLCGHTHGGQLFPFNIFAYFMNKCFSGLYSNKNYKNHVYVTEGINTALPPMRVGSNKTFAVITIEGSDYNEDDEKEILLDKEFE